MSHDCIRKPYYESVQLLWIQDGPQKRRIGSHSLVSAILYVASVAFVRFTCERGANVLVFPATEPVTIGLEIVHMSPFVDHLLVRACPDGALGLIWRFLNEFP